MPIEGSWKVESDWLTHILNLTCGLPLVDRGLFCPPPTSSSACFHKQTTYFSRRGSGTVILRACQHCRIFFPYQFSYRRSRIFLKVSVRIKKRRALTGCAATNRRLSVFVLIVRAIGAWSTVETSRAAGHVAAFICLSSATFIGPPCCQEVALG